VITRWTATATHRGSFAGIEPTRRAVTMTGITIFEITDGRIRALWNAWDMFGVVQQLRA
jgi:predicted ester cyclase